MKVTSKTKVKYKGILYNLFSVDFEENLICIELFPDEENDIDKYKWIRYESCELIN